MRRESLLGCCLAVCAILFFSNSASAAQVWESTFDSSGDGVVDIFNNNSGKVMIGTASGGRLPITVWDNTTNAFTPDKAGRPLGATLTGNNSMSGQYKFNWSTLNQSETQAYDAFGFLGNSSPQTRQILGGIFRHWKVTNTSDHYISLDLAAQSFGGTANFGYQAGGTYYLGTNPTVNDYEARVEYDGSSHVLTVTLLDSLGTTLLSNTADLDTWTPWAGGGAAAEINNFALTHLGWSDYSGNLGDRATVWNMNSLAYYNTAQVPEPASALLAMVSLIAFVGLRPKR